MLERAKGHCAACHGEIDEDITNTVEYGDTSIDLCDACLALGGEEVADFTQAQLTELVGLRANPEAPLDQIDDQVQAWLALR